MTMETKNKMDVKQEGNKLIMDRIFDAPPELMFEVWSSCEHLKHWWGPKEWPMEECKMDFREEGEWHYCLRGPNEGDESWGLAVYREISKPGKIVYKDYFADAEGNINEEMPDMLVTVELFEHEGKTRYVGTTEFDSPETRAKIVEMGVVEGFGSSMDRLDSYLVDLQ